MTVLCYTFNIKGKNIEPSAAMKNLKQIKQQKTKPLML